MSSDTHPAKRIVLTGPTGWIGRALLAMLFRSGDRDALAARQELVLFGSSAGTITVDGGGELAIRPLSSLTPADIADAHVIHLAYLTKDKVAEQGEAEFRRINREIDRVLLDAMAERKPASLFVASSGAASLAESNGDPEPYGQMKLEQEHRFLDWCTSAAVPVLVGRIFNIAGPHINKLDAYALSNFAVQALATGKIEISATIPVFRSMLHVDDLCRIILRSARSAFTTARPLDLCGNTIVEMGDIAELVARALPGQVPITRGEIDYSRSSVYVGAPHETRIMCMKFGISQTDLYGQVCDTVNWIRARGIERRVAVSV